MLSKRRSRLGCWRPICDPRAVPIARRPSCPAAGSLSIGWTQRAAFGETFAQPTLPRGVASCFASRKGRRRLRRKVRGVSPFEETPFFPLSWERGRTCPEPAEGFGRLRPKSVSNCVEAPGSSPSPKGEAEPVLSLSKDSAVFGRNRRGVFRATRRRLRNSLSGEGLPGHQPRITQGSRRGDGGSTQVDPPRD